MGPIRGLKRRKKAEKKVDQNVLAAAAASDGDGDGDADADSLVAQPQPLDWWDNFSRRISGPLFGSKKSKNFESVFKISRKTFDYICSLVKEDLAARQSNFSFSNGKPLSPNDMVAIALRRLSSGESLQIIGDLFGLNQSTVSQVTWRFVESMEERGLHHLQWPSKETEMEDIKSKFEKIRGFRNCCGAIDITHIVMNIPAVDPANNVWYDREKNYSMILQGIVDPEMRFRDIIAGWPGSLTDALVLRNSGFFKLTEEGKRLDGKSLQLSEGIELREYIIGDTGFPLLPWLLTPYQGKGLSDIEAEYNKRHSATRMVAQMALARLKDVWRIIHGVMWMPDKNRLPRIVLVCCLLHNIVIDMEDEMLDELPLSYHHDSGYHQQTCESVDKTASVMRDNLSLYLSGKLPP
ncbi:protein ALP1-like [Citrus sinensis]|uniref:protein ALP1-like n=1 Tax=Citrus sinensis TaxID=2711 RepID=UPI0003D775B1|nr:protein ALP1-like [Citrus sinensis]XP_024042205.1 protein ALP1-like [Citrus x clementina]KAH9703184.1 protein ALP1-like [Citrus sinensis]